MRLLEAKRRLLRERNKPQRRRAAEYLLDPVSRKREELIGLLRDKYGYGREKAEREANQIIGRPTGA
ncbi:MAG: hypothetical protein M1482_00230 [Chloroflexi bacterium]|nr:hypothetical protein [Chloroflexota bacterium]